MENIMIFENEFKKFTGSKYAISVSSCTAGLHLSCLSIGLKGGDEVIVPSQTHTATAHAVEYTGAKAIFSDVDPITGNILVNDVEKKLQIKLRRLLLFIWQDTHVKLKILFLYAKKKLHILEDCAHALGTT